MKTTFELWRITRFFPYPSGEPDDMGATYVTRIEVTSPCMEASVIAMILRDNDFIDTLGDGNGNGEDLVITAKANGDWRVWTAGSGMLELRLLQ